jgi:hypothetical protein
VAGSEELRRRVVGGNGGTASRRVIGHLVPGPTRQKEVPGSYSCAVRCSCARKAGERWSGGTGPAVQCALVNRAKLWRAIAATVSLAKAYQGEHSKRGVVVELR